jgi:peptidoglycan/LPS O-acetylase OafA/YrhL
MCIAAILVLALFQAFEISNRVLSFVGKVSYPVYLFHVPVIRLMKPFLDERGVLAGCAIDAALILLISIVVHHFVEKKFVAIGRSLINKFFGTSGSRARLECPPTRDEKKQEHLATGLDRTTQG